VLTPETEAAGEDAERRVVLHGISWAAYLAIGKALGETTSIRLAYLRGALEIMSPSDLHEARKTSIHNLLFAYAQERDLFLTGYGSTTFRKRVKACGAEADQCYVLRDPRGKRVLAPDLAIEVVLSPWSLAKQAIYAELGVKELWLVRRGGIEVHVLRGGTYRGTVRSHLLPDLDLELLWRFVDRTDHVRAVQDYRRALRDPVKA